MYREAGVERCIHVSKTRGMLASDYVSFNDTRNSQRERPTTVLDRIFIGSYRHITIPLSPIAGVEEPEERPESVDSRYPCSRSILVWELLLGKPCRGRSEIFFPNIVECAKNDKACKGSPRDAYKPAGALTLRGCWDEIPAQDGWRPIRDR